MDEQTEFNPRRRLCPDGTCTGIIGPDGRCGECGRGAGAADDGPPDLWSATLGDLMPDNDDDGGASVATGAIGAIGAIGLPATSGETHQMTGDVGSQASATVNVTVGGGFDPRRRLCDDGSCVGVIQPNGSCGVCGRRAAP
ncbi:MAG: hypothetical protein ABIS92_10840 [Polyangia bacterium]